jgi:hypothetical protein
MELTDRQKTCEHQEFRSQVSIHRLEDTKKFYADVEIWCLQCELPFHFITPEYGLRVDRPAASPTATELRCPIAPGPAVIPDVSMRFEMPSLTPRES